VKQTWINSQAVSLAFLQKIASYLIEIIDQHSHQKLRSQEFQRSVIDLFGNTQNELTAYRTAWEKEKTSVTNSILCWH
jgi:DNA repair ATPase RecN